MSNWKADYIRMWQIYYNKPMEIRTVDELINNNCSQDYIDAHIQGYKLGRLLEAVGKLRFPN